MRWIKNKTKDYNTNDNFDFPYEYDELVRLNEIKVPKAFRDSIPTQDKMDKYIEQFNELGYIDKPLSAIAITNVKRERSDIILIDNYIRYLICKEHNIRLVPVKYIEIL